MRILFIGLLDFSYHCLNEVLQQGGNVVGLVTRASSTFNSDYKDLVPLAKAHNIPVHLCKNVNDADTLDWIQAKAPDIIFCWGWSQIIKKELLALPPMGIIGVHPALLPANRGRHPLIWALVLGLKESGLTFFQMDEGADSGPILSQRPFPINAQDTSATLYAKIKHLATEQINTFLPQLQSNTHTLIPQDESLASYWRKRSPADGMIDWRMDARRITNLVRALTKPYPGAQFTHNGTLITVWSVSIDEGTSPENAEPGKVLAIRKGLPVIKCGKSAVVLEDYEPQIAVQAGDYLLPSS